MSGGFSRPTLRSGDNAALDQAVELQQDTSLQQAAGSGAPGPVNTFPAAPISRPVDDFMQGSLAVIITEGGEWGTQGSGRVGLVSFFILQPSRHL